MHDFPHHFVTPLATLKNLEAFWRIARIAPHARFCLDLSDH